MDILTLFACFETLPYFNNRAPLDRNRTSDARDDRTSDDAESVALD